MKYYIAAEGGGSKLLAALYNENNQVLRVERTRGTNECFRPREMIAADMEALAGRLIPSDCTEVESLDMGLVGSAQVFADIVRSRVTVRHVMRHEEGHVGLASAGAEYGITAQAGTGSDAFMIQPDDFFAVGGWGPLLGDEGSGYHIGLAALKAAVWAHDKRGPDTMLYDLVMREWQLTRLWDMISRIINDPDQRLLVASAAKLCARAAAEGDAAALSIYENAGRDMAGQVLTAIRRHGNRFEGPIVLSGGAWKGSPRMAEAFTADVRAVYPEAVVIRPIFEPVVGVVLLRHLSEGRTPAEVLPSLMEGFAPLYHGKE